MIREQQLSVRLHHELSKLLHDVEFIFLRHAPTKNNRDRYIQGGSILHESILPDTKETYDSAIKMIADDIKGYDVLFKSPATRTLETAKLVTSTFHAETLPELNEIFWGDIDGSLMADCPSYTEINQDWFTYGKYEKHLPGGESLYDFANRIVVATERMVKYANIHNSQKILVSGHGLWIAIFGSMCIDMNFNLQHKPKNLGMLTLTWSVI